MKAKASPREKDCKEVEAVEGDSSYFWRRGDSCTRTPKQCPPKEDAGSEPQLRSCSVSLWAPAARLLCSAGTGVRELQVSLRR